MAALAIIASGFVSIAEAQVNDHLQCYKIKDPLKMTAVVDLDALQDRFDVATAGLKGCVLSQRAVLFCIPVTKSVRPSVPPTPATGFVGPPLQTDQLCYKLKCPKPTVTSVDVVDQFAQRKIEGFVPFLLCAPAIKTDQTPTCENSPYPQCGGPCPDPTDLCRPKNDGTPGCTCLPKQPLCEGSAPQCNGPCPYANQKCLATAAGSCFCSDIDIPCEQTAPPQCGGVCNDGTLCAPNATGKCSCGGTTPTCTGSYPQCGGTCPNAGEVCLNFGPTCDCVFPCGMDATGHCGGICPNATQQCVVDATGVCSCADLPCEQSAAPQCGGVCTDGTVCAVNTAGQCRCGGSTPTCTSSFPQCGGTCFNAGEVCLNFGATCDCVFPCSVTGPGQCGGACTGGLTCSPDPVGCSCQ